MDRIRGRGFLKRLDAYEPAGNVEEIIQKVFSKCCDSPENGDWKSVSLGDRQFKLRFIDETERALGKRVLSSELHQLKTVRDVVEFFKVPVEVITKYSRMARSNCLPKNLHILEDAVRFHPLTDTEHDGVSAFPKSSTYVSSLRYRRFLKGYRAKTEWHHYEDKHFDYTATPDDAPWLKSKAERMDNIKIDKLCYF
uniref:Large ribosomal subunit protein mL50 n=1 Tax=Trichuris muris TaxID=70415 RepID=A0A5S6Q2G0_TRIMR